MRPLILLLSTMLSSLEFPLVTATSLHNGSLSGTVLVVFGSRVLSRASLLALLSPPALKVVARRLLFSTHFRLSHTTVSSMSLLAAKMLSICSATLRSFMVALLGVLVPSPVLTVPDSLASSS